MSSGQLEGRPASSSREGAVGGDVSGGGGSGRQAKVDASSEEGGSGAISGAPGGEGALGIAAPAVASGASGGGGPHARTGKTHAAVQSARIGRPRYGNGRKSPPADFP